MAGPALLLRGDSGRLAHSHRVVPVAGRNTRFALRKESVGSQAGDGFGTIEGPVVVDQDDRAGGHGVVAPAVAMMRRDPGMARPS